MLARSTLVAALLLLIAPAAQADEPAPEQDKQVLIEAQALLSEANAHYAAERYDEARAAYEAAYELTKAPGFLYNIAQSHRLALQCRPAIEFYEKFLAADPKTPLRGKTEGFVAQMWTCLEKEKEAAAAEEARLEKERAAEEAIVVSSDGSSTGSSTPSESQSRKQSSLPLVGLAVSGMGVLGLGTSAYFGLKARSISDDVESFGAQWGAKEEAEEEEAQQAERLSIVLGVAGGTALLGGLVIYLLTSEEESDQSLALEPTQGGATLSFSTRY